MGLTPVLCLAAVVASAAGEVRGVHPSKVGLYDSSKPFACLDGTKTIPFAEVNDEYCDCADGSDEPGTAACSRTLFHCPNARAKALDIPSYRVNDGLCDCCDGSDEHDGPATCGNTCEEEGRALREAAVEAKRVATAGHALRVEYAVSGAALRGQKKQEIDVLDTENMALQIQLEKAEAKQKDTERPETKAKKEFDDRWDVFRDEKEESNKKELFDKLDADASGAVTVDEVQAHTEFDGDEDAAVSEEEAQEVLDLDGDGALNETEAALDYEKFKADVYDGIKDKFEELTKMPDKPEYDQDIKALISAADAARAVSAEIQGKKNAASGKLDKLRQELEHDWGEDQAFAYMLGQCYEAEISSYKYKVCPFDSAKQEPKAGGSATNLGSFKGFVGKDEDGGAYTAMEFSGGQKCWNGPNRSMKVKLKCGASTVLSSVIEPSMCEYESVMTTPALCADPATMGHDEL